MHWAQNSVTGPKIEIKQTTYEHITRATYKNVMELGIYPLVLLEGQPNKVLADSC